MTKQKSKKYALGILLGVIITVVAGTVLMQPLLGQSKTRAVNLSQYAENFDDYLGRTGSMRYLSDEDVNPYSVRVGYDQFRKNAVDAAGTKITLKYEGQRYLLTMACGRMLLRGCIMI